MNPAKLKAIQVLDNLDDEQYVEVMKEAFGHRKIEVQRNISRYLGKKFFKNSSKSDWKGVSGEKETPECPDQSMDTTASKQSSSTKSAMKSPFIYRGDRIPEKGVLIFDVEKLILKMLQHSKKHENAASSVAIINEEKELVMWSLIKWDQDKICRIPEAMTGLSLEKLSIGQSIEVGKLLGEKETSFGSFVRCGYPRLTPSGDLEIVSDCGRYSSFWAIPSWPWRVTTVIAGSGATLSLLVGLTAAASCCISDVLNSSSARFAGTLQLLSGLLIVLGVTFYPLGWGNKEVQDACSDQSGPYDLGPCKISWSMYLLAGGVFLLFLCFGLSFKACRVKKGTFRI